MPFRSEKQRRFLWAEHPEIAKRWAHEYPESNKGLPMYADKKTSESEKKSALEVLNGVINKTRCISILDNAVFSGQNSKAALDKTVRVELPQTEGPTYAGQEREQGGANQRENVFDTVNAENSDQACATDMMRKLSVVLSRQLREEMELEQALAELREPRYVPENLGVRRYALPTPGVVHPAVALLAMQQQEEQNKKAKKDGPVGGGSNPQFNPINSFGALSSTGDINGNAAFGQKNSPDSSKTAGQKKSSNNSALAALISIENNTLLPDLASDDLYADELGKQAQSPRAFGEKLAQQPSAQQYSAKPFDPAYARASFDQHKILYNPKATDQQLYNRFVHLGRIKPGSKPDAFQTMVGAHHGNLPPAPLQPAATQPKLPQPAAVTTSGLARVSR